MSDTKVVNGNMMMHQPIDTVRQGVWYGIVGILIADRECPEESAIRVADDILKAFDERFA